MLKAALPSELEALLSELATGLRALYGERYRGLLLFGSYARGEAHADSDVDLLLILRGEVNIAREIRLAGEVLEPLALESGELLALFPVSEKFFRSSHEPFLQCAKAEGLWLDPVGADLRA